MNEDEEERLAQEWYDQKAARMEEILGAQHDIVMHAIIPYAVGGGLDLYYYPNGVPGVGIATMECSDVPGEGSSNNVFDQYELVMFTRCQLDLDHATDENTPFGQAHSNINAILNHVAPFSAQATLNPNETCEFPADMERVGGKCLMFDGYGDYPGDVSEFGLLAVIEVFRSEMDWARARRGGGAKLIQKLKDAGHYPYSDLDREPLV